MQNWFQYSVGGGRLKPLQFLAKQLTLSQTGPDYTHHSTTSPHGLSDLATGLDWACFFLKKNT